MNNLQLWNATNPHYACAELVVQYQGVYYRSFLMTQLLVNFGVNLTREVYNHRFQNVLHQIVPLKVDETKGGPKLGHPLRTVSTGTHNF